MEVMMLVSVALLNFAEQHYNLDMACQNAGHTCLTQTSYISYTYILYFNFLLHYCLLCSVWRAF